MAGMYGITDEPCIIQTALDAGWKPFFLFDRMAVFDPDSPEAHRNMLWLTGDSTSSADWSGGCIVQD